MKRIENPSLEWHGDQPFSKGFEDVYFSRADGLAETRAVFIDGNNLLQRWPACETFTIAETGFGTGLNFLTTWKLFEETAPPSAHLDFISFERYPMAREDLQRALHPWRSDLGAERIDRFLNLYPSRTPGFHRRWITPRITLTLVFDDALYGLQQLDTAIDAWFLDGFSPSRNPLLWHKDVFHHMARLSHQETTLASFTAAGDVRRGLEEAGFTIQRHEGFAHKRHRITGHFSSGSPRVRKAKPKAVTLVGAGIAGAGLYLALQRRGIACTILEKESAAAMGASGNFCGLLNPRIEAQDNARTDIGLSAFSFAQHILREHGVDVVPSGALHLAFNAEKENKLRKIHDSSFFLDPVATWISANESQALCGLSLPYDGLFYHGTGTVCTRATVQNMLTSASVSYHTPWSEDVVSDNPVILCNGLALRDSLALPLQPVRGQVLYVDAPRKLSCPVMFGHYCAPVNDTTWTLGATFDQNNDSPEPRESDDTKILESIATVTGLRDFALQRRWAQVRTATRDRYPLSAPIPRGKTPMFWVRSGPTVYSSACCWERYWPVSWLMPPCLSGKKPRILWPSPASRNNR